MMVAVNDGTAVQYLLTDHLGSTVAVTNSSGTLTSQQRYLPFGEVRTDITSPQLPITDFGYTGQRKLDDGMGGIMDYDARFYSPALGRFLQPDTDVPASQGVQGLNRYAYVNNNPIRYNDPTGHWLETAWDIANIAWDIAEVRKDPSAVNIGALILDVAAAILPVVPAGAGLLVRGAKVAAKADDIADLGKAADKTYTVYRGIKNGVTEYVGITTDFFRRRDEHNLIGRGIEPIMAKLSKYDAHAVEQVLIENFGRVNKEIGGTLSNINNSISKRKQYYEEALGRGVDLLDEIVPEWSLWK